MRPIRFHGRSRWSSAVRTACSCGRAHPSKMESRVCVAVRAELRPGDRLYHQVRLPLWALPPQNDGRPHTLCVDFVVVRPLDGGAFSIRLIEAKAPTRVSRDWRSRAAACEATYGVRLEERSR